MTMPQMQQAISNLRLLLASVKAKERGVGGTGAAVQAAVGTCAPLRDTGRKPT